MMTGAPAFTAATIRDGCQPRRQTAVHAGAFLASCIVAAAADLPAAMAVDGYAATVHPLATQAALDALARGGNAVDAAVAAGLTLGVVDGHNSGIGGGCFILLHLADGRLVCIDGRETAPAAATRDMFLRDGKAVDALSRTGPLASDLSTGVAPAPARSSARR